MPHIRNINRSDNSKKYLWQVNKNVDLFLYQRSFIRSEKMLNDIKQLKQVQEILGVDQICNNSSNSSNSSNSNSNSNNNNSSSNSNSNSNSSNSNSNSNSNNNNSNNNNNNIDNSNDNDIKSNDDNVKRRLDPIIDDLVEVNSFVEEIREYISHITYEAKCRECDAIVASKDYMACVQCNTLYCNKCLFDDNDEKFSCRECHNLTASVAPFWVLYFMYQHCLKVLKKSKDGIIDAAPQTTALYISMFDKFALARPAGQMAISEIIEQILAGSITSQNVIAVIKNVFEQKGFHQWFVLINFGAIYALISPCFKLIKYFYIVFAVFTF